MHSQCSDVLTAATCPLCGADTRNTVLKVETTRPFDIQCCRACDFTFAAPRPDDAELQAFYTSSYFRRTEETVLGYANYRAVAERNARRMWKELVEYAGLSSLSGRRVLDVGCATGGFLHEAKSDGWNTLGVELSTDAASIARTEFGLEVIEGDVFASELHDRTFDLITCWHVVEHLIDPVAAFKRMRELIAPGGLLFVELPNWNSLGRRVRQEHWSQLKPPEHINFFTPQSLSRAVEMASFTGIKCSTHYPSINNQAAIARASRPWYVLKSLGADFVSSLGCGGYLRILAKPQ